MVTIDNGMSMFYIFLGVIAILLLTMRVGTFPFSAQYAFPIQVKFG